MKRMLTCLLSLVLALSCVSVASAGAAEGDAPTLYDANACYVTGAFGEGVQGPLYKTVPTYRMASTNDVTYVTIDDFVDVVCKEQGLTLKRVGEGAYNVLNSEHLCVLHIDARNNVLTYYRQDLLWPQNSGGNDGVTGDPVILSDALSHSEQSHYVGAFKDEVIDLNVYHLGFILSGDACYAPVELFSAIFFKGIQTGVLYNGVDLYEQNTLGNLEGGAYRSFYANTDRFLVDEKHEAVRGTPAEDEAYRFAYSDTQDGVTAYYTISLKPDGTGGLYRSEAQDALGELVTQEKAYFDFGVMELKSTDVTLRYRWHETEEGVFVDPWYDSGDEAGNAAINNESDLFKIPKRESFYGALVRSPERAELNYNLLAFTFDKCYGLTATKFPEGFYRMMEERGLREGLMATDSLAYDDALLELTMGLVDDCHTAYMSRSVYSGFVDEDMTAVRRAHWGERRTALEAFKNQYKALRTEVMSKQDPKYEDESLQQGLFIEGATAVIRWDAFMLDNLIIPSEPAADADISQRIAEDAADGVELAFREIAKNGDIRNVVFDLTCNTGGVLAFAPYLLGYMTDDPEMMLYSSIRDIGVDLHYRTDINRDGVCDENDTLKDRYNFYILTSEASFSCANTFAALAKYKGIKTIGHRTAGGACEEIIYTDTCGSRFYSSAEMMIGAFDAEGAFTDSDGGIEPDYVLEPEAWYDLTRLNAFIEELGAA